MSNIEMRACASAVLKPSSIMPSTIMPAMPVAAEPAPRNSTRWSFSLAPVTRNALKIPTSAAPAVPWMSSL